MEKYETFERKEHDPNVEEQNIEIVVQLAEKISKEWTLQMKCEAVKAFKSLIIDGIIGKIEAYQYNIEKYQEAKNELENL